ncbi:MAG: hypothetical protein IJ776_01085 [Paludibacteraceae bacterium]|nr:hypothetical protein [Paludibacteraceae bacterium]
MRHLRHIVFAAMAAVAPIVNAEWQAPIANFTPDDYQAGTQNWQLTEQHNSWIYAANNYGLLEYDGEHWRLYGMPTPMRSLCLSPGGEIYAGGSGEFGVYRPDELGRMKYTSLSDSLRAEDSSFGDVWNICTARGQVYIQTRNKIFVHHSDGSYQTVSSDAVFQQICLADEAVYVACSTGIYLLAGTQLNLLRGSELLEGYEVRGMRRLADGRMLIATDLGGMYVYDGNTIKSYNSGVDSFIKKSQLYCFAINDRYIAYGTVLNGVVVTDYDGRTVSNYSVRNGLCNNTVLSLMFAKDGSLWVGMDQGVAHISLSSALQYLRDNEMSYGSGYCAAASGGRMYFGTNQGLYAAAITDTNSMQVGPLSLVEGSQGQVWNLREVNGVLLCCHNRGLFAVRGNRLVAVTTAEGYWDICRCDRNIALAGTYSGISVLRYAEGNWKVAKKIEGYGETALHVETDETGALWTISEHGVMRLIADGNMERFVSSELVFPYNERHDWYSLSKVDGQVFISSDDTCAIVDRNGYLMSAAPLTSLLEGDKFYEKVCQDARKNIWFIADGIKKVRLYDAESHSFEDVSRRIASKKNDYVDGFPNIYFSGNGKVVSGSKAGFYVIDTDRLKEVTTGGSQLLVRRIRDLANGEVIYGESYPKTEKEIRLPYGKYNLRFEAGGIADFSSKHLYYSKMLPVEKDYTPCGETPQRDFRFDGYGKYTLEIQMVSELTGQMFETSVKLEILPPWYKTMWARLMYVILGIVLAGILAYAVTRIAARYKRKLMQKKDEELRLQQQMHEREAKEQEMRILQLEHEKAMYELKNKSEKLSGLMLNQIGKNELAQDVLGQLQRIQDDLKNGNEENAEKRLQQLQQQLSNESNNDVDWQRFEDNFDDANNQFLKKLSDMYPELTKNERRLCVYIHMGLYTKEIAPLLGISTRGVEMMRYRMRNKLDMEPQEGLREFLQRISNDAG